MKTGCNLVEVSSVGFKKGCFANDDDDDDDDKGDIKGL
jgi:hypothetical protein